MPRAGRLFGNAQQPQQPQQPPQPQQPQQPQPQPQQQALPHAHSVNTSPAASAAVPSHSFSASSTPRVSNNAPFSLYDDKVLETEKQKHDDYIARVGKISEAVEFLNSGKHAHTQLCYCEASR